LLEWYLQQLLRGSNTTLKTDHCIQYLDWIGGLREPRGTGGAGQTCRTVKCFVDYCGLQSVLECFTIKLLLDHC